MDTLAFRLTLPPVGCVEDFHLQVDAPCRAHRQKKARQGRAFTSVWGSLVAAAALAGLSFVDLQAATLAVGAVQGLNGLAGAFFIHLHKAEAAGATGFAVLDDVGGSDLAVLGKQGVQISVGGRPGQISNIDVLRQDSNLKEKK